jgi:hypothetical protein
VASRLERLTVGWLAAISRNRSRAVSTTTYEAKCGKCELPLEVVTIENGQKRASCPKCGNNDTLDNVRRIIAELVKERTALAFHDSLVKGTRGSKFLKVSSRRTEK